VAGGRYITAEETQLPVVTLRNGVLKQLITRMWADAQRDGRPLLEYRAVTLPI